jgi:glycogen operon protein
MGTWAATEGAMLPMGQAWVEEELALNFSLFAQHAESVELLLFSEDDPANPLLEYRLDPRINKTWNIWHCRLAGPEISNARYYAYRIDGPRSAGPGNWHAYDPQKALLDPNATEIFFPPGFDRRAATQPGPNLGRAPLGVLRRLQSDHAPGHDRPRWHESDARRAVSPPRGGGPTPGSWTRSPI